MDATGKNLAPGQQVTSLDSIEAPVRWAKQNLTDGRWAEGGDPQLPRRRLPKRSHERAEILGEDRNARSRPSGVRNCKRRSSQRNKSSVRLPPGKMVYAAATHFKPQGNFKPTEGKLRPIHVLHRGDIQSAARAFAAGCLATVAGRRLAVDQRSTNEAERRARTRTLVDPR